jgi:hyperosmotically inducible periplasmic protein
VPIARLCLTMAPCNRLATIRHPISDRAETVAKFSRQTAKQVGDSDSRSQEKTLNFIKRYELAIGSLAVLGTAFLLPIAGFAQDQSAPSAHAADNSAANKEHGPTAGQQTEASADKKITQKIRRSVVSDKSLSTNAHNCKIITRNGMVTLKGPVDSEAEKQTIASKATDIVGSSDKVNNQLTVKQ